VRKPSKWIKSRLYNKDGSQKFIDTIEFVNGYRKDSRRFIVPFLLLQIANKHDVFTFSNGLQVTVEPGDLLIYFGKRI
jgi:hypothetical protein